MNNFSLVSIDAANDPVSYYFSYGSHATCMSRATSILSDGFRINGSGRRGVGAYFWHASSLGCEYARNLAHHWYTDSVKRQAFHEEADQSGAVLWAEINAPQDEVLDLERPEFRTVLRTALSAHWPSINSKKPAEKEALVCSVHEMLISKASKTKTVSVVVATVTPPKMPDELAGYVGNPYALIVRNLRYLNLQKDIERVAHEP